jgi:hypothetical protein
MYKGVVETTDKGCREVDYTFVGDNTIYCEAADGTTFFTHYKSLLHQEPQFGLTTSSKENHEKGYSSTR